MTTNGTRIKNIFGTRRVVDDPPADVTESAWGGTRIQAGRIMLRLCADSEGGNACLVAFLKKGTVSRKIY